MYNFKVEPTTNNAIKLNLDGIKISKEGILLELYKILDLDNFLLLNESFELKKYLHLSFRTKKSQTFREINQSL